MPCVEYKNLVVLGVASANEALFTKAKEAAMHLVKCALTPNTSDLICLTRSFRIALNSFAIKIYVNKHALGTTKTRLGLPLPEGVFAGLPFDP